MTHQKKDKIIEEILKLPDGAWMNEDEIKNQDPVFQNSYRFLIRKRKFLEDILLNGE